MYIDLKLLDIYLDGLITRTILIIAIWVVEDKQGII